SRSNSHRASSAPRSRPCSRPRAATPCSSRVRPRRAACAPPRSTRSSTATGRSYRASAWATARRLRTRRTSSTSSRSTATSSASMTPSRRSRPCEEPSGLAPGLLLGLVEALGRVDAGLVVGAEEAEMLVHEAACGDLVAGLDRLVDLLVIQLELGDHLLGGAPAHDRRLQHGEDRRGGHDEQLVLRRLEQEEVEVAELGQRIRLADARELLAQAREQFLEIGLVAIARGDRRRGPLDHL